MLLLPANHDHYDGKDLIILYHIIKNKLLNRKIFTNFKLTFYLIKNIHFCNMYIGINIWGLKNN